MQNKLCIIIHHCGSWLSPFHKQTASPFSSPTKVTAKNMSSEIKYIVHILHFPFFRYNRSILGFIFDIISCRRSCSFAEYWKHFMAHFNNVHASGYNSAGSKRIWMKFGALRVYCLELGLADFGRDPRRRESDPKLCFFLSGKQRATLPICGRPNFTKVSPLAINPFGTYLWKFACKGSFFPKRSTIAWKSSSTSDFTLPYLRNEYKSWKVTTGTIGINSKSFPWPAGYAGSSV